MIIIRIIVTLINSLLRLTASILVSGIGLLVTALTIVLIAAALGAGSFSGFEALRGIRKRRKSQPPK